MSRRPELYHWRDDLASHLPGLTPAFVFLLALWSFGMILARRCGLNTVALQLSRLLGDPFANLRQRLREFYKEAPAKAGAQRGIRRRDFDVADCFAPLLAWVLSFWSSRRLALALDVTNVGERFHVLCLSVVYGGIGIPVAWKILLGNEPDAWHPHWCDLLRRLQPVLGPAWDVVVVSDRGLESARLFREIVGVGWHPLMRAKAAGKFRPAGWVGWYPLAGFVPRVGSRFATRGTAYKTAQEPLVCTLLACWTEGHAEPWLLLTDLPVRAASPCWYAFRSWVEQGFKMLKRGGLQWQNTRMKDPGRAERVWLALAVATLWLVVIGAVLESDERKETLGELPRVGEQPGQPVSRAHRLFALGLAAWVAAAVNGTELPSGKLPAELWADTWHDVLTVSEQQFLSQQTYP
jgi:hypothetical protein